MKKQMWFSTVVAVIASLMLAACAAPAPAPAAVVEAPAAATEAMTEAPTVATPETTQEPPQAEPIKIGFYGPLTGPVANAGRALMQGAQMKFDEVNAAGGVLGSQIGFITCDDMSKPEEAVKCVQRLITEDKVVVNVGSLHSPHIMATAPILDKNKVPTVAAGTSPTWCGEGFKYVWRATANANAGARALFSSLDATDYAKMAILYQNDDYGIGGRDAVKENFTFAETVSEEAFNLGDKDWSGQILKMIAAKPDFIVVWALGEDMGQIFNQLRTQGWDGTIVAAEGATYPDIGAIAGENANGVIFAQLYYIPPTAEDYPDPAIMDYLKRYESKYGALPEDDNAYRGYDAATVLVTALEKAGSTDPEKVRDAINSISDLVGLAGTFNYAKGGEGIETSRVWTWVDGKIVAFEGFK